MHSNKSPRLDNPQPDKTDTPACPPPRCVRQKDALEAIVMMISDSLLICEWAWHAYITIYQWHSNLGFPGWDYELRLLSKLTKREWHVATYELEKMGLIERCGQGGGEWAAIDYKKSPKWGAK